MDPKLEAEAGGDECWVSLLGEDVYSFQNIDGEKRKIYIKRHRMKGRIFSFFSIFFHSLSLSSFLSFIEDN